MTNISTTVRSFVAVELPGEVKRVISETDHKLSAALGSAAKVIRWVQPESVHLTLLFLGDVPIRMLKLVERELAATSANVQPFSLRLGNLGVFPNIRRARVLWVGLEAVTENEQALILLQRGVAERLGKLGFKEDKAFRPHLTLGRVRGDTSQEQLASLGSILEMDSMHPEEITFKVDQVVLMKSELRPGGSNYTRLSVMPFHTSQG